VSDTGSTDEWAERLRENRAEKDRFFTEHRQSPIPPDEREAFDGLEYFEPAPEYRVEATVVVHEDPEPVGMDTSDGRTVRYRRIVTFAFELGSDAHELHGYRRENEEVDTVFVPFRDKTTGQQTYHGGRYMELEPDRPLEEGDRVTLDFNLAYSPFCAYRSEAYVQSYPGDGEYQSTFDCPLPPEENWLEATIEAGERMPGGV
jgi:uncharacterized protein (DUF1684 family)